MEIRISTLFYIVLGLIALYFGYTFVTSFFDMVFNYQAVVSRAAL
ncbi:MAG: hypothetical protein VYA60_07845 [Pseudomonadota bacterium]|nr:hypothetical protein [Pseudomonadota bacterium]